MRLQPRTEGTLQRAPVVSVRPRHTRTKRGDSRNPNLKKYIASVGWSDTCVYAGGSTDCSYDGGSVSDTDASSTASLTDEDSRTSSCRLSRVPLRLVSRDVQRAREGRLELVWLHHGGLRGIHKLCVDAADIFWSNEASKARCECGHPPYVGEDRVTQDMMRRVVSVV